MTTIEGGMVCTDDLDLYNLMRAKRSHGLSREMDNLYKEVEELKNPDIDPAFLFPTEGYNFRNTELGAVLGLVQLKKLDTFIAKRYLNYKAFYREMIEHPWIKSLPNPEGNSAMTLPFHCHKENQAILLKQLLNDMGVETRPFLVGNILKQPFMKDYRQTPYLPNTEEIHTNSFYVGNNHFVTPKDIKLMAQQLHQCVS